MKQSRKHMAMYKLNGEIEKPHLSERKFIYISAVNCQYIMTGYNYDCPFDNHFLSVRFGRISSVNFSKNIFIKNKWRFSSTLPFTILTHSILFYF